MMPVVGLPRGSRRSTSASRESSSPNRKCDMRLSVIISALAVAIGLSSATAADPDEMAYMPNSTKKVCQLTGDFDRAAGIATLVQTEKRFGVVATDLGSSFEHKGKLYFLGSTWNPYQVVVMRSDLKLEAAKQPPRWRPDWLLWLNERMQLTEPAPSYFLVRCPTGPATDPERSAEVISHDLAPTHVVRLCRVLRPSWGNDLLHTHDDPACPGRAGGRRKLTGAP